MTDDFATGIDLLSALAAGKQRGRSESSNDDSGSADVDDMRFRGPVSSYAVAPRPAMRRQQSDNTSSLRRSTFSDQSQRVPKAPHSDSDSDSNSNNGNGSSRDGSAAAPPIGSAAKASAEAKARARRPVSGNKRARSALSPWEKLLHNLMQQAHHNDLEPSYCTVVSLEAPAAHALRMLAESFLRRRWEQAIAAATHVRKHEFST